MLFVTSASWRRGSEPRMTIMFVTPGLLSIHEQKLVNAKLRSIVRERRLGHPWVLFVTTATREHYLGDPLV